MQIKFKEFNTQMRCRSFTDEENNNNTLEKLLEEIKLYLIWYILDKYIDTRTSEGVLLNHLWETVSLPSQQKGVLNSHIITRDMLVMIVDFFSHKIFGRITQVVCTTMGMITWFTPWGFVISCANLKRIFLRYYQRISLCAVN